MPDDKNPEIQTIIKTIGTAKRIAIVLPQSVNIDLVVSATALSNAIALDPTKTLMTFSDSNSEELPSLAFIKNLAPIHSSINTGNQLSIKISNRNAQPGELRYEKSDTGLMVFITPKSGQFKETDVAVVPAATNFDLVIILGATNFEQLGNLYTNNTKLFFETPHINIDIDPANEYFGTMNFVQTTASSISEVVMDIVEAIPKALTNETISTALLTGIISQTSSFRDPKTTPQAMLKASRLVAAGAKQQDIIQHLFKTKPLPLLQLWGRALARLVSIPEKQVLTAVVTKSDLEKTKVGTEVLPLVVKDIAEMITGYSLIILLAELTSSGTQVVIAGLPFEDIKSVAAQLQSPSTENPIQLSGKYKYISIFLSGDLEKVQGQINEIIENRNTVV